MQAIDSSWEVQQGDKVHREFVRLVFEKQDSFEWIWWQKMRKKWKKNSVHQKKKRGSVEALWKSPSLMGALILNIIWGEGGHTS